MNAHKLSQAIAAVLSHRLVNARGAVSDHSAWPGSVDEPFSAGFGVVSGGHEMVRKPRAARALGVSMVAWSALSLLTAVAMRPAHADTGYAIPGLFAASTQNVLERHNAPDAINAWSVVGDAFNVTYVTSGNKLWQRGAIGPGSGNDWTEAGDAFGVAAMTVHQGHLYVVSANKLWRRGAIGPGTGNDWVEAGDAPGATSLAGFNGHLYMTAGNMLWQRGAVGPGTGNDWTQVGDAIGVRALAAYDGHLFAVAADQLFQRGAIGPQSGNDWTYVGDAVGVKALASVPLGCTPVPVQANCAAGSVLSIVPHQDDDLYFINPVIQKAIAAGKGTRTIFVTEGFDSPREMGAKEAHATMAGVSANASWTESLPRPQCASQTVQVPSSSVIPRSPIADSGRVSRSDGFSYAIRQ